MKHNTWEYLTDIDKGELLLAHHNGTEIEYFSCWNEWRTMAEPGWNPSYAYRVKPGPIVKIVNQNASISATGKHFHWHTLDPRCTNVTHTFTITDGVVTACDTIIHN
jgi:hypothetical protein